jgi:hypothetical protein
MSCDQFKNRFCSAPIISGSPHIVSSSERDTIASPFSKIDRYCPRNLRGEFCHIPNPNHGKVSELSKPRFPSQGGRGKTPACLLACLLGMLEPTSADEPVHHEGRPGPAVFTHEEKGSLLPPAAERAPHAKPAPQQQSRANSPKASRNSENLQNKGTV